MRESVCESGIKCRDAATDGSVSQVGFCCDKEIVCHAGGFCHLFFCCS